jgi:hypothetical protein
MGNSDVANYIRFRSTREDPPEWIANTSIFPAVQAEHARAEFQQALL